MRRIGRVGRLLAVVGAALALAVVPATANAEEGTPAAPCPSLEGCYGHDTMLDFYNEVLTLVDDFSAASYAAMPRPTYWFVYSGQIKPIACGAPADGAAFFYCSADGTVYVGQDQLFQFYLVAGDGAAAFAVAHEWGHFVQNQSGVLPAPGGDRLTQIRIENQADCVAGAFLGYLRDRDILEADDYDDINTVLPMIASAESEIRDHGTLAERDAAAQLGHDGGLAACNAFFPDLPLIT